MRHFESALRDFIGIEPHCRLDWLIVLHDCLPVDDHMARRNPRGRSCTPGAALICRRAPPAA